MGGPIVRTGTTPAFWANWDQAFGKAAATDKKKSSGKSKSAKKAAKPTKAAGKGAKKAQKKKK